MSGTPTLHRWSLVITYEPGPPDDPLLHDVYAGEPGIVGEPDDDE